MTGHIYDKIVREKNGKTLNITIQQVTPELAEPVIQHMIENFIPREPLSRHTKLMEEPESVESFKILWRKYIESGAAIVALLDEGNGSEPKVIGANVTGISRKTDPPGPEFKGEKFNYVLGAVIQTIEEANIWERYGVDCCLSAVGLSVDRNYHGIGLGTAIVNAREKVCEIFHLPITMTCFTAIASQTIAAKCGFETVVEHPYKDFNYKMGDVFRDLEGKINIMVKRYK